MAGTATGAKRARALAFSAHERYMHKSGVVMQREGKKIRAFLVRKVVAQLKQSREQHTQASAALETEPIDEPKRKRAQGKVTKLFHQVAKLETELALLKTLDLKAVVARAFDKTGLKEDAAPDDESDDDDGPVRMTKHDREMQKYGRGRVDKEEMEEKEEEEEEEEGGRGRRAVEEEDEDDGFNSEDYDEVPRSAASDSESNSEDENGDDVSDKMEQHTQEEEQDVEMQVVETEEVVNAAVLFGPMGPPGDSHPSTDDASNEPTQKPVDPAVLEQLVDRVLAHNQMQPFLDAIRQYVAKRDKDQAKKRRQKEKSAIKRARASMIGGRSSAAPTSMFFGSLSGAGSNDEDIMDVSLGGASMAGADDDIAEFLGETKKKKNRAGQMARRQKAIRMEEARRGEQDGGSGPGSIGSGGFHNKRREAPSIGKYGPSERPKKQVKKDRAEGKPRARDTDRSASRKDRDFSRDSKPSGETTTRPERRTPAAKPALAKPPQRKPEAAPSHPSWLAKQALKEKMKVDITAFAGKKITFGDD